MRRTRRRSLVGDDLHGAATALLARYAWAIDDQAYDELHHVFTADVRADYEAFGCHGVTEVVRAMERIHRGLAATQHLVGSVLVEPLGPGPGATVRSHVQATLVRRVDGVPSRVVVGASYRDEMIRTSDGWRIADRHARGLWVEGDRSILSWLPQRRADRSRPRQGGH